MSTSGSQNISPEVDFRKSKMTSESQNVSPEVDFRKSKKIFGSRLPEVKKYLTSGKAKKNSSTSVR